MLIIKPADLTYMSKHHNGQFPFWQAYRTIDGREVVRVHGTRDMPIWGLSSRPKRRRGNRRIWRISCAAASGR
jgi:hypothetical protein